MKDRSSFAPSQPKLKEMEQNAASKLKIPTFETPTVEVYDDKIHSQNPILQVDDENLQLAKKSRSIEITKE